MRRDRADKASPASGVTEAVVGCFFVSLQAGRTRTLAEGNVGVTIRAGHQAIAFLAKKVTEV